LIDETRYISTLMFLGRRFIRLLHFVCPSFKAYHRKTAGLLAPDDSHICDHGGLSYCFVKIQRIAHCVASLSSIDFRDFGSSLALLWWVQLTPGTVSYDGGACSVGVNDPLSLMKVLCGYSALGESLCEWNSVEFGDHQNKVCFLLIFFQTLSHFFPPAVVPSLELLLN